MNEATDVPVQQTTELFEQELANRLWTTHVSPSMYEIKKKICDALTISSKGRETIRGLVAIDKSSFVETVRIVFSQIMLERDACIMPSKQMLETQQAEFASRRKLQDLQETVSLFETKNEILQNRINDMLQDLLDRQKTIDNLSQDIERKQGELEELRSLHAEVCQLFTHAALGGNRVEYKLVRTETELLACRKKLVTDAHARQIPTGHSNKKQAVKFTPHNDLIKRNKKKEEGRQDAADSRQ